MIKSVNNYPVSQLFDDVGENGPGYFLGSIKLVGQVIRPFALTGEKPC
jgi:hypothetical protein